MEYKEQAIPLLLAEKDGKYTITSEAKSIITSIKTPIAVVSVAGLYRTGKSYLLNRMLLNRSNGFGVGPTVNPCTKGLWMWGAPVKTRTEDGQPLTLLIIDTQGLGATDQDDNHDNKIFSLAILLSTCFVYNSVGSIDQNAIQSLNLVLNLSQTIYQQSSNSKMDTRQLPSFFWVVRDFSLQLIDQKGNHISSKQYLQNALALQKGFGKDIQQKNKVRKFIAECFTIRDCFTMVRPTNVDSLLQELDKVPFEQLRPEFIQQVMNLRKRVLGRLQPKKINNNVLDGQAYFSVVKTYVDAINNGAVPNIQTAWQYICAERNQKLLNEAEQIFSKGIKEEVSYRIPCLDSELRSVVENVKKNALNHYLKGAWGQKCQQSRLDLEAKIKQKQSAIYTQNEKQSVVASQNIITKEYQSINKKLKSGLYNTFSEFQHDIKSFYMFLMQHNRKFQSCQMVYMQFINKRILQASQFFFKNLQQQVNSLKETKLQLQSKGDRQNGDLRNQYNKLKLQNDEHVGKVQRQKVQALFNLQQLKKQLSSVNAERQQIDSQKDSRITMLTNQVENLTKQLRSKQAMLENKVREGMRDDCLKNAEWQKQKALYLQQQRFFKQRIETLQRKQKQSEQIIVNAKNELEIRMKQFTTRAEDKTKSISQQLAEKKDKLFQATSLVKKLQQDLKALQDSSDLKQRKLRSELLECQTTIQGFKNNDVVERNRLLTTNMNQKRQILQLLDQQKQKVRMSQIQLREVNEQLKHNKISYERDQAIHSQKIQFQQIQLKQLKAKYSELQTTHQNALLSCENASKQKILQLQNGLMFDLKNSHERQIKQLEAEWESKMRFSKNEVENYKRRKDQLELTLQIQTKKNQDKQNEYRQTIRQLEQACQRVQVEKLNTEQGTAHFKRQIQIHYETKIKRLEHELQSVRDESRKQLSEAHEQSQVTVRQLKSYYELQKQRLERKIQEQKQKAQKRAKKVSDEYEQRLTEQKIQFEEELATFKNNLSQVEQSYQQKISNMQYQFDINLQKTNDQFNERRIQFQKQSALNQQQLDYANKRFENLGKQKETLQLRYEQKIKEIRNQFQQQNRQAKERMNQERVLLDQKYEKVKIALRQAEQNLNKLNIDFEKQRTILKSKQASLQAHLSQIEEKSRLKLRLKEDQLRTLSQSYEVQRMTFINQAQRYKIIINQLEDQKNKIRSSYQSQKNLLMNKINFSEQQVKRYKIDYEDTIQKFQTTVKHLSRERDKLNIEKTQAINEIALSLKCQGERQIESLKNNHTKICRDYDDKINRLQTEKKNLNDKILNLEVRLTSSANNNSHDLEKKYSKQMDKQKRQYEQKLQQYQKHIENFQKQQQSTRRQYDDRDKRLSNNQNICQFSSIKNTPYSNTQYIGRESQNKRSKITTIPQQAASGTSLLNCLGNTSNYSNYSGISKKSNTYVKQKLFDLGDFGSPYNSKKN